MQPPCSLRLHQSMKYLITAAILVSAWILFSLSRLGPAHSISSSSPSESENVSSPSSTPSACSVDIDLLRSYGFESAEYARWEIQVEQTDQFKGYSDNLDLPYPSTFRSLKFGKDDHRQSLPQEYCEPTVTIQAPAPSPPVDASHIILGVATSIERLDESLSAFAHWAGGTRARIFALVENASYYDQQKTLQHAKDLDIELTVIASSEELLDRYFSLTRVLLRNRNEATEWAVIIDDDTFFPSMANLVKQLATYDHTKPFYIGAPTENFNQMGMFSFMAYGGAGVFLSIPLLEEMDESFDQCYEFKDTGDKRVSRCIYLHTSTKLTWDHRLFQLDMREDISGFYEAGRPLPLSLHHWKSWVDVDVVAIGKIAAFCGDDCQLRRWRLSEDSFFVNGFSVFQHSYPMHDMKGMEQTWDASPWAREEGYAFSLGPLREKDELKVSMRMRSVISDGDRVRQIYVRNPVPELGEPPRVLEVVWRLAQ